MSRWRRSRPGGMLVRRLAAAWGENLPLRLGVTMAVVFGALVAVVLAAALFTARHVMLETVDASLDSLAAFLRTQAVGFASPGAADPRGTWDVAAGDPPADRGTQCDGDAHDEDHEGDEPYEDDHDKDGLWERLEHRERLAPDEVARLSGEVLLGVREQLYEAEAGEPVRAALDRVPQIAEGFLRLAGARGDWLSLPQPLGTVGAPAAQTTGGAPAPRPAGAAAGPPALPSTWVGKAAHEGIAFGTWGRSRAGLPGRESYRLAVVPVRPLQSGGLPGSTYYLALAVPLGAVGRQLEQMARWLGLLGLLALGPVAVFSALTVQRAFRPVETIARVAGSIDDRTLSARIEERPQDRTLQKLVDVLNAMLDRLEKAFGAQARFVQDASHELRTPLARLRTGLDLALRRRRTDEEYRRSLEAARREVDRLTRLSNHLLWLARHDQGEVAARDPVDLAAVAAPVLDTFRPGAAEAGVALESEIPAGLSWPVERVGLEQILTNLVENALRATGHGGRVWVRAWAGDPPAEKERTGEGSPPGPPAASAPGPTGSHAPEAPGAPLPVPSGPWLWLEVGDTGKGIPPGELERVFERFVRLEPGRDPRGGAGLGLSICRAIAQEHGGVIRVESEPGYGSRFQVAFPPRRA
ncbi:sensor histidine kinase [Limnochorda pilosa]|uniref:histidine kinase n=1 Tax=Limnochorda pilosa TaxID=1555112 RepID=A0A0K2SKW6_LIMPI|nr:HAMP domain-containing sensor histidine kinase [Limnochorda pilosa]BAS27753.1 hypothetical protein LIP_1912 [Limnochorda pilosa]